MVRAIYSTAVPPVIALVCAGCFLQSQQSRVSAPELKPSLAETAQWLGQTFGEGSHIVNSGFEHLEFDDPGKPGYDQCYLHFFVTNQGDQQIRFMQLAKLADIDPTSIKASELIHDTDFSTVKKPNQADSNTYTAKDHPYVFVSVKTTNNNDAVVNDTTFTGNAKPKVFRTREHEVGYPGEGIAVEPEYAPRFASALRHAVELCGGKPSAF